MVDLRFILHLFVGHAAKRETIGLLNLESANTSNDSAAETTSGFELPPRYAASGYLADSKVGQTFGERKGEIQAFTHFSRFSHILSTESPFCTRPISNFARGGRIGRKITHRIPSLPGDLRLPPASG
jgi:hypothetical protein